MADQVLLVVAENADGEMVAGALNLIGSHALYGRQWGCEAGREYRGLHFECCYYQVGLGCARSQRPLKIAAVSWGSRRARQTHQPTPVPAGGLRRRNPIR
jgi:predicted N-acyltransferase